MHVQKVARGRLVCSHLIITPRDHACALGDPGAARSLLEPFC